MQRAERAGQNVCGAYHPEAYVRGTMARGFEVVDFIPGEVFDRDRAVIGQDVYLLRKPS